MNLASETRSIAASSCTNRNSTSIFRYANRIVRAGNWLALGCFFLAVCSAATAQLGPSAVFSAILEDVTPVPEKTSIHVNIRNTGNRPITAFSVGFYQTTPDGGRVPCGGRGADMIDWSDPMPGRGILVHMRRNWIAPNGTYPFDVYPRRCASVDAPPLESIKVEVDLILFDDGTGEGDTHRLEFYLRTRRQMRTERLKWIDRFTGLRSAPDLHSSAQRLYQELVDAAHAADINPQDAAREGMAKPVRDELQRLALEITQWAAHGEPLEKNELLEWRITDLEQRTARLVRGAGSSDEEPKP